VEYKKEISEQGLTSECAKEVKPIKLTRTYEQGMRTVGDPEYDKMYDEYGHPRYPGEHTD
jgi:hypothetical protein